MKVRNLTNCIFRESLWCFQPLGTSVHHQVRGFKIQIQSFASFTVSSLLTCFIWHDKDMQCLVYKRLFVSNLTLHKRPPLYLYGLFWNLHIFLDHLAEMVLTNCYSRLDTSSLNLRSQQRLWQRRDTHTYATYTGFLGGMPETASAKKGRLSSAQFGSSSATWTLMQLAKAPSLLQASLPACNLIEVETLARVFGLFCKLKGDSCREWHFGKRTTPLSRLSTKQIIPSSKRVFFTAGWDQPGKDGGDLRRCNV